MPQRPMFQTSYIELSRSALARNIKFLKRFIGPESEFMSVIKGNAYGHSIKLWVPMAEGCGVRHFGVFSAGEAYQAYVSRTKDSHITIMGMLEGPELEWAIGNGLSFFVFERGRLDDAIQTAKGLKTKARIHIELETGLNRTGFERDELDKVVDTINANREHLSIEGLCTHYAGAESVGNYLRIRNQIRLFNELDAWLKEKGIVAKKRHSACSAAALSYPATIQDMVRFGIAHYGFWPSQETKMHYLLEQEESGFGGGSQQDPLRRVLRWKSCIMSVKTVERGSFVGYGTSYQTSRRQQIATVPVGYFHGFARNQSNLGHVLVRGRRAPVVGVVNMNMILIDVTDLKGIDKGEEVVLIGRQKKNTITVSSFGDLTGHINYEVLVRLPSEIPRIVV